MQRVLSPYRRLNSALERGQIRRTNNQRSGCPEHAGRRPSNSGSLSLAANSGAGAGCPCFALRSWSGGVLMLGLVLRLRRSSVSWVSIESP